MLKRITSDLALLVARIVVGVIFMAHGLQKWQGGLENTTAMFSQLGVPSPQLAAVFATVVEIIGGAMLIIGLGVRLAAALLFADMVGAGYFVESRAGVFNSTPRWELVVALAAACLLLMALGGGRISVDGLLNRAMAKRRDRRETEAATAAAAAATAEPRGSVIVSRPSDEPGSAASQPDTTQPETTPTLADSTTTAPLAGATAVSPLPGDADATGTERADNDSDAERPPSGPRPDQHTEPPSTGRPPSGEGASDADTERRTPGTSAEGPAFGSRTGPADADAERRPSGTGSGPGPVAMGAAGMAVGAMGMSAMSGGSNSRHGDDKFHDAGDPAHDTLGEIPHSAEDTPPSPIYDSLMGSSGGSSEDKWAGMAGRMPGNPGPTPRDPADDRSDMNPDEGRPSWLDEPARPGTTASDHSTGEDETRPRPFMGSDDAASERPGGTEEKAEPDFRKTPEDLQPRDAAEEEGPSDPDVPEGERTSEPRPLDSANGFEEEAAPEDRGTPGSGTRETPMGGHSVPAQGGAPEPPSDDERQAYRTELEELRAEVDRLKGELAAVRRRLGVGGQV
ncbi:DoxX family membrane protein [Nonomuraea africana]|uniref:DoxX family membrane protein n=1 Tax=Nonomuraea africana TaxID=46171 RepID=UPI0033E8AEF1